jgi:hypothetical protein
MSESEQSPGYCSRSEEHNRQKIQYFCLEDSCELNRLLCKSCIGESHRRHKVGIIDKLITPLNRLGMNIHHPNSQDHYEFFQEKINLITEVLIY